MSCLLFGVVGVCLFITKGGVSAKDTVIIASINTGFLVLGGGLLCWAADRQFFSSKAYRERIDEQNMLIIRLVTRDQARESLARTAKMLQSACERNAQIKWEHSQLSRDTTANEVELSILAEEEVERLKSSFWWLVKSLKQVDPTYDFKAKSFKDFLDDEKKEPAA
jgi:hypothetical protein